MGKLTKISPQKRRRGLPERMQCSAGNEVKRNFYSRKSPFSSWTDFLPHGNYPLYGIAYTAYFRFTLLYRICLGAWSIGWLLGERSKPHTSDLHVDFSVCMFICNIICMFVCIVCRLICSLPYSSENVRTLSITVEPRLSGTLIIRLGSFLFNHSENGRVPQMRMRVVAVTMETCLLIFCACAYNHVVLLFINKVGGSRRGLSIWLSGIFTYPACFWNQGVRIIEILLYSLHSLIPPSFIKYAHYWVLVQTAPHIISVPPP